MIYKATPIRAHRVQINTAPNQFFATNGFDSRLSDLHVLSHFNENQSMMHQYHGDNKFSSSSRSMNMPFTPSFTPFTAQTSTVEQHGGLSIAVTTSSPSYEAAYMHPDMPGEAFGTATTSYEVPTSDDRYGSFGAAWPAYSNIIHPPMVVPAWYFSSAPAPSPVPSVSPAPSPQRQELQIRMSQPCYEMGQRHHEILPLETGPFKK